MAAKILNLLVLTIGLFCQKKFLDLENSNE